MNKQRIKVNEQQLHSLIKECVAKVLNEAESGGWNVETEDAQLAYQYFCEEMGSEAANEAIVRALGDRSLSEVLAYLFRMYDMRGWEEYLESHKENY